jgi:hypothetical protein
VESSRNTNYWPGFVDALTNTVIAMIFLVIVLTIALSAFINLVVRQRTEKLVQQHMGTVTTAQPVSALEPPPEPRTQTKAASAKKSLVVGEVLVQQASSPKDRPAVSEVDAASAALVIKYSGNAVELDEKSALDLDGIVQRSGLSMTQVRAEIVVRGPEIFLSENQRSGFFRAMSARNYLMRKGVSASNVTIRFEDVPGAKENLIAISILSVDGSKKQ